HLAAGPPAPRQPQFVPDRIGLRRGPGRPAGRPRLVFWRILRQAHHRGRHPAGGARGHPAGGPDAVPGGFSGFGAGAGAALWPGGPFEVVMTKKTDPILTHGGDWAGFAAEYGAQAPLLDFSANVSPLGLPAGVAAALAGCASGCDRYPDPLCRELTAAIARAERVPAEWVLCGNGAADLIWRGALALRPGRALVTAPAFAEYEAALAAVGCRVERYALREAEGFRLDEGFLEAIRPGVGMVFLCEPNNPTGLTSPRPLLLRVLERCRQAGALLVADECFGDFLADPAAHTLKGALEGGGLLLLKAFTKLYGMAGVRLGYGLCADPALLATLRAAGQPWAVSTPAQAAGLAALKETGYVQAVRALIADQRPRLAAGLAALGCQVLPGEANYLLFRCGTPLAEPLRRRGILL